MVQKAKGLALSLLALTAVGCSDVSFQAQKSEMLKTQSVFGDGAAVDPQTGGGTDPKKNRQQPGGSSQPGNPSQPGRSSQQDGGGTPSPSSTNGEMPIQYICSNRRSEDSGTNLKTADSVVLTVTDAKTKQVVCTSDSASLKTKIMNEKKLDLSACQSLPDGDYIVVLKKAGTSATADARLNPEGHLLFDAAAQRTLAVMKKGSEFKAKISMYRGPYVLYDINDRSDAGHEECDYSASPLIVDMRPDVRVASSISLTSPLDGVMFDILGQRSFPLAHSLKRISWLRNTDYMFIVKPNAQGRVNGVDEMFGDNTRGPDGRYAANGFAALAKFDGADASGRRRLARPDGLIDSRDAVFSELRLWSDMNLDGKATPDELFTLDEMGVEAIDLVYDPSFKETDKYGNETKLKSAVRLKDHSLRLLFDLWFRYL